MTLDEARKIGLIAGTADHGCSVCIGGLVDRLNAAFPEFRWTETDEPQIEKYPEGTIGYGETQEVGLVVAVEPA